MTGTLVGIRPFVEFIAAPFWSSIAERFHKSKAILLFSLGCWIVFTFSLAFIRPPASACVIFNETHHILYTPYSDQVADEIYDDTSTLWPATEETNNTTQGPVILDNDANLEDTFVHAINKRGNNWCSKCNEYWSEMDCFSGAQMTRSQCASGALGTDHHPPTWWASRH